MSRDLNEMRAAFELWFSDEGKKPSAVERNGDVYRLMQAQAAWWAWQAAWNRRAPAAPVEAALTAKPLAHGHREDFYLMANARRILNGVSRGKSMPNWVLAMELFATGSTSACQICRDAGIDPAALKVERIQSQRESAS